ncbi:ATP-dependent DNA helicase 2 subunit 1 [Fusarium phyllophilum]|uniref:ATP-dependent DNA helicase II subunit 1 n=1 Tax=Fusarium phyllophilum TaxID=47803 RepID=A0A8H5N7L1_9HYPO|nr:ATP-dependent DNA helicase 2 subunit 1 [Fusarium phyllophilum]
MADKQPWRKEDEDEEEQELDENKDAILLAIDVGKSMLEPPPPSDSKKADRDSPVQAALKCAYHLMEQRIISNPKDMMGILLFGTKKSKFQDSVDSRSGLGYPHCYLFTDLDVPAAEDVQALKTLVEDGEDEDEVLAPSDEPVSMSNVLFCANQIFTTKAANFGSRRLFIVTDNDNPHVSDKQAKSAAAVRAKDLYDLGILIDLFPITRGDEKFDLNKFYDDVIYRDPVGEANMTEVRTSKSGDGLTLLNSLISNVNSKQTAKRALFSNLPFEIAPGLRISVKGYNIVHRQTPARTCYIWLDGEKPQIATSETTRIAEDSAKTVEKAEIKKAYKFGGEYVYFSPDEQKSLKDFGSPIIRIIGFKPRSLLPVWASTKKSTFIFPSEEDYVGSTRVFTALWQKLLKDDRMGVAWCITRANAQPMLAAIIPSRERSDDGSGTPYLPAGLWIYPLPFQDDLRNINPPSEVLRSSGELTTQMRTIIQQLQLPKAMYDPLKYPNPALQWHYRILQALALEEEVPEKADDATEPKYKAISKRAGGYLEEWSESLEEESGKVANKKSTKRETDDEDMERPVKKSRGSSEKATGSSFSMAQLKAAIEGGTIQKMTVVQLKDILATKGLSTAGRKVELLERIEEWIEETPVSGSQWRGAQATPTKRQLNTPLPLTSSIKSVAPPSPTCAFVSPQTPGERRSNIPSATLVTSSPEKEPGADEYNSKLLRLTRRRPTCEQRETMADFLASLGLGGAQTPAASSNSQCDSVEELQHKLRSILDAKATPTRAEHVALTIELRATVRFQLPVSESENGTLESLNNIDPSLGGAQSVGMNGNRDEGQLSRVVFANDTIMNQPQDDPTLQRSVAKHIISIISSTDGSTWTVREVSRGTQGWTLTYLCKDSYQQWTRQNAKNQTKTIVGEFSQREPDPVLHARPAFDCRGSITIAFNRGSRSITVKYDHTPLHKTVAELAAHFKPAPRQLGPGTQRLLEQQQKAKEKTPRKPRGEKKDKKERKKRDSTVKAQDENGNPRKRKKKNNGASQPADSVDGPMIPPDYPGAPAIDGQNQGGPSYMNGGEASGNPGQQGFNDYPQGLMGDATTNGISSQQANGQMASAAFPVNVSAAEAARRKEAATTMLSNAGVDPTTLSPEQFGIFANQAPELQRESLNMLVKYGAERLRIVHPGNKEGSTQASSSTQSSQTTSTGPRTTKELVPQSSAQSNANTDTETAVAQAADDTSTPKRKRKKMSKSRTACFPLPKGETNLHRMATKTKKSEAIVIDDDDDDGDEEDEEVEQQEDAEGEGSEQEDDEQQDTSQDYSYPQMNIGNMVTNTDATTQDTQPTQSNYYQPASGLVLPQPDPYSTSSQAMSTSVPQRGNYSHNLPEVTQPMVHPAAPIPAPAGTIAPSETRRWTAFGSGSVGGSSATSKTRRSLPSEPSQANAQNMPANPQPSDWAQTSNTTMPTTTMASVSPQMTYDTRSSGRTRQKNQSLTNDTPQQAAAVPNTVMQQAQARQSPVAAAAMMAQTRKSPYQQAAVPRTTSRTSQRNQSRTPVTDQARGYQPPSDMAQQQNTRSSNHYDTSHMSSGSGYNDYGRYSSTSTSGSHQPPTTMSTSYQTTSSTANQWSNSSSRNDRSYGTNPSYQTPNIYAQTTASKPTAASRQNFNMRSNTQQHTRASSGSYNQQQPQQQQQGYASYSGSAHQSQQAQTSNQQQPPSWYFQNSHNPSVHPGGQSSGYNYEPWSGV